jgi:hypothetical protein
MKKHQLGTTVDKSECIIWQGAKNGTGYPIKWHNGKARLYNRVLWAERNGPIPKGRCICHKCDTPSCINLDHLFLGSYADNLKDCRLKGREKHARGEAHGLHILSDEKVRRMRRLRENGAMRKELAIIFGVSKTTVTKVCRRQTWTHVE